MYSSLIIHNMKTCERKYSCITLNASWYNIIHGRIQGGGRGPGIPLSFKNKLKSRLMLRYIIWLLFIYVNYLNSLFLYKHYIGSFNNLYNNNFVICSITAVILLKWHLLIFLSIVWQCGKSPWKVTALSNVCKSLNFITLTLTLAIGFHRKIILSIFHPKIPTLTSQTHN